MFTMEQASARVRELAHDFIESERDHSVTARAWKPRNDGGVVIYFSDNTREEFSRGSLQTDF